MTRGRTDRGATAALFVAVIAMALAGLVLDAGSVPHTHAGLQVGLYNQEHDLAYLATFSSAAALPAAVAVPLLAVIAATAPVVFLPLTSRPRRLADSRAPPA